MIDSHKDIKQILHQVKNGSLSIEEAKYRLQAYEDFGFVKLDYHREQRTGFPEVVYGLGKTTEQMITILEHLVKKSKRVLATRVEESKAKAIRHTYPDMTYNTAAQTLSWIHPDEPEYLYNGYIAIICAGTSDLPVAEEAAVTAEVFGCQVNRIYDVGVAGIHRLFDQLDTINNASCSVVVAGMEGALTSVVGGLVRHPVFAVPTSVGYGANFQGLSALLAMLNSCSPGVSVVNIDNGFGGGYNAALMHSLLAKNDADRLV